MRLSFSHAHYWYEVGMLIEGTGLASLKKVTKASSTTTINTINSSTLLILLSSSIILLQMGKNTHNKHGVGLSPAAGRLSYRNPMLHIPRHVVSLHGSHVVPSALRSSTATVKAFIVWKSWSRRHAPHMREILLPVRIIRRQKVTPEDTCTDHQVCCIVGGALGLE